MKRIIIKLGTNVLTRPDGRVDYHYISNIVGQMAELKQKGKEIMIVTSGAIGAAMGELGIKKMPTSVPKRQALAAIGQSILMQHYKDVFARYKIPVAQILLSSDIFLDKKRTLNLHNSIRGILKFGAVPIINENDPIFTEEIDRAGNIDQIFGDNDGLCALLAVKLKADLLIMLTDVNGLCDKNPKRHDDCELIAEVPKITKKIEKFASGKSNQGRGGMKSKLKAAKIATKQCDVVVANSRVENVLVKAIKGESVGTLFLKS